MHAFTHTPALLPPDTLVLFADARSCRELRSTTLQRALLSAPAPPFVCNRTGQQQQAHFIQQTPYTYVYNLASKRIYTLASCAQPDRFRQEGERSGYTRPHTAILAHYLQVGCPVCFTKLIAIIIYVIAPFSVTSQYA